MAGTLTTGWVSGITGGTPTPLDFTSQPRDVTEEFTSVSPLDTPFVARAGGWNQFEVVARRDHEWQEEDLWKQTVTVSSTTGVSATDTTTITLSAAEAYRIIPGAIVRIDSEDVLVTAVGATSATLDPVVRGYRGSTAATHATASTIDVIGQARIENSDAPYGANPIRTFYTNYPQFFNIALQMSLQARNQDLYGRDKWDEMVDLRTKELAKLAERSSIFGIAYAGASGAAPSMGGILAYLTSANGAYNTSLSSAALTEANLYTAIRSIANNVGENNLAKSIVTRYFQHQKISGFYENRVRTEVGTHTGGVKINSVDTDFGTFDIMHYHSWPESVVAFINFDKVKLGHTRGLSWSEGPLAVAGAYDRVHRYGEYTLEVRNPQTMGQITSISTTS